MQPREPNPQSGNLRGRHIVVTRPEAQAHAFCAMLEAAGASVTRFPVIEIQGPRDPAAFQSMIERLERFDIAVFVSANAVRGTLPKALERGPWPARLRVAAIGAGTARVLAEHGVPADIVPATRFDSEALLEEPDLQNMQGRKVVLFRGDGGREHLAGTFRSRGAEVVYAEAYRRRLPKTDPLPLLALLGSGTVDAVTVTSGESLRNLMTMLGPPGRTALAQTTLVAGGGRVADVARELGFPGRVLVADDPTDPSMYRALLSLG